MNDSTKKTEGPAQYRDRPTLIEKIGRTTFQVYVFFNKDSKETLEDKIRRIIGRESQNKGR